MNRAPSEHLDDLLLALAKLEYRDFVGINPKLADSLIEIMEVLEAMLEYELKVRDIETFMPVKLHRRSDASGSWPG